MKELGTEYMSEFSGEDIQPEVLAEELGLNEFRLPDEHYQHAEYVSQEMIEKIIPYLRGLNKEQIGDYLVAHREELFEIFDTFPEMHRFPLLVKKDVLVAHGILSAQLLRMSTTDFFNAFLQCMHFYLYLRSVRKLSKLYQRYPHVQGISPVIQQVVNDECSNEVECAWGMRSSYFFDLMVPGEKGIALVKSMLQADVYTIPPGFRDEYTSRKVAFWRREGLGPERILLNLEKLVHGKISPADQLKFAELDVPALNFFLCQNHILGYEEIISKIFRNPDHTLTWVAWIDRYFDVLMKHDSQARKVFYYVFGLEGSLFENGAIPNRLKREKEKTKKGTTGKGLPEAICSVLEKQYRAYRDKIKKEKKNKNPPKTVAKIIPPEPLQNALSELTKRLLEPVKITVPIPDTKTLFPDLEDARKNKTQLTQIDFSQCDFPEGTMIRVERSLPAKKPSFELLNNINAAGLNSIPAVFGRDIQGHFIYRITITLPSTHRFEGKNVFEVSYYAKAEPTIEEVEEEEKMQEALRNQPKTLPIAVATLAEKVTEQVEHTLDPISTSFIALGFILEEKEKKYSMNGISEEGSIEISISPQDAEEVLGKADAGSLVDGHRKWTIRADGTIEPPIENENVENQLLGIVRNIRHVADEQKRNEELQQVQEAEQREYEQERLKFTPILEFARGFQFEGKQNGHFDAQKKIFIEELRALGWSLPVPWSGSQVKWRHIGPKVEIIYTSKQCVSFVVNGEQSELTGAQKKCYEEVAQAFAHIARFFNVEAKERTRMVNREKAIRKETETGAVAYDKLLQDGRARLVLFGAYRGGHGVWSSKFPTEKTPYMLDVRASHGNIETLLAQHPHAELCYRRDLLCINGEVADDAGEESIENTLQNIHDLRNSPRARYILKKRILITFKLEKFSGENDRAPIKHEKNKREGTVSALDILLHIKEEKNVQSAADITEDFLDYYIDELERNRIRVHYVWPLSARLDEHQARIKKHAAKLVASEVGTTAG